MKNYKILSMIGALVTLFPVSAFALDIQLNLPDYIHAGTNVYTGAFFAPIAPINVSAMQGNELGQVYFWPYDAAQTNGGAIPVNVDYALYASTDCSGSVLGSGATTTVIVMPAATTTLPVFVADFTTAHVMFSGYGSVCVGVQSLYTGNIPVHWLESSDLKGAIVVTDQAGSNYLNNVSTTSTRIITVTPADKSTIATSTTATIGVTGYMLADDFESGTFLEIRYGSQSANLYSLANVDALLTTIRFPLTSSGFFSFSTTTNLQTIGTYQMQTSIKNTSLLNSFLDFLGFTQLARSAVLVASSTSFKIATSSDYDIFVAQTTNKLQTYSPTSSEACSSGFSFSGCIEFLIIPKSAPIFAALKEFKDGFLSYWPWGYITRFMVIITGYSDRIALPTYTVPLPLHGNSNNATTTWTIDMQEMFTGAAVVTDRFRDPQNGLTIQEEWEPIFLQLLAIIALFIIIFDLVKLRGRSHLS